MPKKDPDNVLNRIAAGYNRATSSTPDEAPSPSPEPAAQPCPNCGHVTAPGAANSAALREKAEASKAAYMKANGVDENNDPIK